MDESSWLLPRSGKDGLPGLMQEWPRSSARGSYVLSPVETRPEEGHTSTKGGPSHPPLRAVGPDGHARSECTRGAGGRVMLREAEEDPWPPTPATTTTRSRAST